ncbi:MAG TPA: quinolinate synthase NadA [Dehalococcoidia bacterium]|jgi:quinolinate synthase|nr:quinolinate synthase NadA [Dehalococcoidia bacterium]MDP6273216.1 quinolinate synthase NadA [Dehalococcoidia bacterium]MDP7161023.1 quinolinate synthase NadA [Dehalococcoidia bacterium]HJM53537.1 quinolinate synthase NadA [Dehalococcoidia bacterium]
MTTGSQRIVIPITELEQSAFCRTDGNLRTLTLEEEFKSGVRWQKVPIRYLKMTPEEINASIASARETLGDQVLLLGHHYQREDVFKYADLSGDSYKLSRLASENKEAEFIVFCGVHFMAETADVLSGPEQTVILPNMAAGCSMADMAQSEDVEDAWEDLTSALGGQEEIVPITYMNSAADIKALCGRSGGIVCTSSNADLTFEWAFERSKRVLFLPDQHLGRNTALKMGIPEDEIIVWNPFVPMGGHTPEALRRARVILWQGHCSVHTRFTPAQVQESRARYPDVNVIVHPECTRETVDAANYVGSTEYIVKMVSEAPAGSIWGIGTEINLVNRLAKENPDKTVFCLDPVVCPCATMYRIHPAYLLWVLDGLMAGLVINAIKVEGQTAIDARVALRRMLDVAG